MTLQVHIAFQVNSLNCGEAFPNHQGCCSGAWLDFTSVRLKLTNMSLTGGWEQWKNGWKSTICTLSKSQVSQISRTCIAVYVQLDNICSCISRLPAVRGQRLCFGFNLRPWAIATRWQCRTMGPWVWTLVIGLTKNAMRQPLPFFWWYPTVHYVDVPSSAAWKGSTMNLSIRSLGNWPLRNPDFNMDANPTMPLPRKLGGHPCLAGGVSEKIDGFLQFCEEYLHGNRKPPASKQPLATQPLTPRLAHLLSAVPALLASSNPLRDDEESVQEVGLSPS